MSRFINTLANSHLKIVFFSNLRYDKRILLMTGMRTE
ncbi:hypothetical protein N781_04135 [Pontibacillus halophilus JSM 076056 = DSM 19796]|uniref:Uncharacterized protein n=1 Tax=Pontibacillus halophilus JSM 076056 = DSM 19796 TaxID=1385510 RepID=A0A0A5I788_9BACI|nr:hypothetical protein N781_04135 [Pontibacillus halophilus JSM 076056 = DSM 19796]